MQKRGLALQAEGTACIQSGETTLVQAGKPTHRTQSVLMGCSCGEEGMSKDTGGWRREQARQQPLPLSRACTLFQG